MNVAPDKSIVDMTLSEKTLFRRYRRQRRLGGVRRADLPNTEALTKLRDDHNTATGANLSSEECLRELDRIIKFGPKRIVRYLRTVDPEGDDGDKEPEDAAKAPTETE